MNIQTHTLHENSSATILKILTEEGIQVALKVQTEEHPLSSEQDIVKEYNILKMLQHPNIIGVGDYYHELNLEQFKENTQVHGFSMELAQCDLQSFLHSNHPSPFCPSDARRIFLSIAKAIAYLHSNGICHNDIKIENILLFEKGEAKLTDFGFASYFNIEQFQPELWKYRAPSFLAPEVIKACIRKPVQPIDLTKTDSFAFGVCLFESFFFCLPFKNERAVDNDPFYTYISQGNYEGFWNIPIIKRLTNIYTKSFKEDEFKLSELKDLINNLLTKNPMERFSFDQILAHPWFSSNLDLSFEQLSP